MAEASFAQTFISSLDSRPVKLSADHAENPKTYPARPPYILPRMPVAMSKRKNLDPGHERLVTVVLKSLRNPPIDIHLTSQPLYTSLLDLKTVICRQTSIPFDRIKILHEKRPLPDTKILRDVLREADTSIEFSVMAIGGSTAALHENANFVPDKSRICPKLETDAFWADLEGYLMLQLNDRTVVNQLICTWRGRGQDKNP